MRPVDDVLMPAPVPQLTPALPLVSLGVADNDPRANAAPCFPEGNIDRLIASVAAYLREEDVQRVRDAYELSASAQVKLLHLLEQRAYHPLGSSTAVRANVRIISATNVNLEEKVAAKEELDVDV